MNRKPAEYGDIIVETHINVSPELVWQSLTQNIHDWWPSDFYAGGEEGKRRFSMDATPGGFMKEVWDNGGGVLWATVVCANPGVQLQIHGCLFPNWGGPSQSYGTWDLSKEGNGTKLRFSESTVGRIPDLGLGEKQEGWGFLSNALKEHVEGL